MSYVAVADTVLGRSAVATEVLFRTAKAEDLSLTSTVYGETRVSACLPGARLWTIQQNREDTAFTEA